MLRTIKVKVSGIVDVEFDDSFIGVPGTTTPPSTGTTTPPSTGGTTPPAGSGAYSTIVRNAFRINRQLSVAGGGVFPEVKSVIGKAISKEDGFTILYKGQKIYFYVDPKDTGLTGTSIRFLYVDFTQAQNGPIKSNLYILDANDNLMMGLARPKTNPTILDSGEGYNYIDWPYAYHSPDKRYLIEIDTTGLNTNTLSQFRIYVAS